MIFLSGQIEHIFLSGAQSNDGELNETFYEIKLDSFADDIVVRFLGNHRTLKKNSNIYVKKTTNLYRGDPYYEFMGYS